MLGKTTYTYTALVRDAKHSDVYQAAGRVTASSELQASRKLDADWMRKGYAVVNLALSN